MSHVWGSGRLSGIRRVHDYIPVARCEKLSHICLEDWILDQMIYHVQRQGHIGGQHAGPANEVITVVQKEALGRIIGETPLAQIKRGPGHVKTYVARITGQRKLVPVTATELHHGPHPMMADEAIKKVRLDR